MTTRFWWMMALVAAALGACGSESSADTSVANAAFCDDYLKRCPSETSFTNHCRAVCSDGIQPSSTANADSICWQTYCTTEVKADCVAAQQIGSTNSDVKACAVAHGWFVDD
jgi:hypothetical protein